MISRGAASPPAFEDWFDAQLKRCTFARQGARTTSSAFMGGRDLPGHDEVLF